MRVPFARIGKEPVAVKAKIDETMLTGELSLKEVSLALFRGRLTGKIRLSCDICAKEYDCNFDEAIRLLISDGAYKGGGEDALEAVIEQSGYIDLEEILRGEIASSECDYHRCDSCQRR
ncbi:MAG: DUF177 domain-containing protein [Helicobacteraceae bacterium]|jgi:hypothetical protein|nr:DUF177 domain-containing protein [Helicobacteraceae bacterium]